MFVGTDAMPDLAAKLRFLQSPDSYGAVGTDVAVIETHMSWVFLVSDWVFKLKKPVCLPYLDFQTVQARAFFCREEVRLNARLAPGVYLGVLALQWHQDRGAISETFGQSFALELAQRTGRALGAPIVTVSTQERYWYNPNLNSRWFFVPGLIGTLCLITIVNLTAFAVVREREVGTLEQLLVTPIQPLEFIIGKTVPFFLIGMLEVCLVAIVGMLWFHVPFKGNPLVCSWKPVSFCCARLRSDC